MAYIHLHEQLDKVIPKNLLKFIKDHLDMQFNDIHCMLRLPISDIGLTAGCNFAIANTLLSLISGLASLTCPKLDTSRIAKDKFVEVITNFYPWQDELSTEQIDRRSQHLYKYFRSPLAHSFGVRTEGNFWVIISRTNEANEARIEELERGQSFYEDLIYEPIRVNNENIEKITLVVDNLYANTRKMFRNMMSDVSTSKLISDNLSGVGID